ncbi:transglutaminase domain-containing protein [Halorientalis pallida]|uniref:Transglutaminase domain-containing protein n=1 Tax=Halorientalis pallida TaxID=2479928 RepID=A0A498L5L5_9EURY|nr:transglutaminase domain-containing protein [Halorientalis pallida]RXK49975.1 transglutaminase domain-containing protein [Halorientalis pallida]
MASDAETASRERARTVVALLAIAGFVLVALVLPAVGADAPGRSLLPGNASGEAGSTDGSGALGDVLAGRAGGSPGGGAGGQASLVDGLMGSLSGTGGTPGAGTGRRSPSTSGGSGFGALDPGQRTGVGSQGSPLSASLRNQSAEPHFLVRSSAATYWRTGAYERYTGTGWSGQGQANRAYWPRNPGVAAEDRRTITQEYRLLQPASALPAAWKPVDVDGPRTESVRLTDQGGLQYRGDRLPANTTYTVTSAAPPSDPDRLRAAGTDYPDGLAERYTVLPDSTPDRLRSFTDDLTADTETPYRAAVAIERWLEANKEYSLNASHEGGNVADQFVFEMERGYCEYFASTMAVMLRTQDIPARYVVGYSTGEPRANGTYLVRAMNAHAWVEVYVPDTGWVRFDPTPGRSRLASEFRAYQRAAENGNAEAAARRFLESASREDGANPVRPNEGGGSPGGQSPPDGQSGTGDGSNGTDANATEFAQTYNHTESGSPGETFDVDGDASVQVSLVSDPVPGQSVAVRVERDGTPLAGAVVAFDGRRIGTTNASGLVTGTIPFSATLDVTVTVPNETAAPAGSAALALANPTGTPFQRVAGNESNTTRSFDVPTDVRVGVEGEPGPGEPVTVNATIAGRPVPGANVSVNGTDAGRTDADGRLDVSLPVSEHASVRVERGEAAGNRSLELANLSVAVSGFALPGLSVTVTVTDGGDPVPGATVGVGDSTVETGEDGTASLSLPLSTGATVTAETPAGLTETRPVRMRFLTAGLVALLALAVLSGAYLLRRRALDAGRSLREQLRVALHWLSGAFVSVLVALAVRGEALLAALPAFLRRVRDALAALARDLAAAVRARRLDLGRLPGPRPLLARLLAALRGLLAGVRDSLPGGDATTEPDGATATTTGATADAPAARERVRRAWREFRAQVPVADHRTKTPGELARKGVDAGFPRTAVRTLRDAIRDVEYGRRDPAEYVDDVDDARRELSPASEPRSDGGESDGAERFDGGDGS